MTTVSIDYIWQLIRETERGHGIQFMDDELLITAAPHGPPQAWPNQSGAAGRESIAHAADRSGTFGTWLTAALSSHHNHTIIDRR